MLNLPQKSLISVRINDNLEVVSSDETSRLYYMCGI